jgi:hypothetical protein
MQAPDCPTPAVTHEQWLQRSLTNTNHNTNPFANFAGAAPVACWGMLLFMVPAGNVWAPTHNAKFWLSAREWQ